jgi:hypothetical protein
MLGENMQSSSPSDVTINTPSRDCSSLVLLVELLESLELLLSAVEEELEVARSCSSQGMAFRMRLGKFRLRRMLRFRPTLSNRLPYCMPEKSSLCAA